MFTATERASLRAMADHDQLAAVADEPAFAAFVNGPVDTTLTERSKLLIVKALVAASEGDVAAAARTMMTIVTLTAYQAYEAGKAEQRKTA